jgi:hypothetical protein
VDAAAGRDGRSEVPVLGQFEGRCYGQDGGGAVSLQRDGKHVLLAVDVVVGGEGSGWECEGL